MGPCHGGHTARSWDVHFLKVLCISWVWRGTTDSHRGVMSDALPISHCMPQGSILEPLLFMIFINNLQKITNLKIALCASEHSGGLGKSNEMFQ